MQHATPNSISLGYNENPRDNNGIIRAQISGGKLRSWDFSRTLKALEALSEEWGGVEFPGVYILFHETKKEAYVGEAKSVYNRLKTHIMTPEEKIKDWGRALVINDGRIATQSDFNDTVIRKTVEHYLIKLMKINKYRVLSQGEMQIHNSSQKTVIESLMPELNFLLLKKNVITKLEEKIGEEEVLTDDLRRILEEKHYSIEKWGANTAQINGEPVFIRPGSKKPKGWQITIRGRQPGSFIDCLQKGKGFLLMPRDGVLLIPLKDVQKIIESDSYTQDTVDVWVSFKEDKVELSYKSNIMDITPFKVLK